MMTMIKRTLYIFSMFAILFAFHATVAGASVVYVSDDKTGDYICDGTDDDVEINQALEYIDSIGGGTVYLKSGTYVISDSIKIGSDTILTGDSDTVLKLDDNVQFADKVPMILIQDVENVKVHGFEVDGNFENNDEWGRGTGFYYVLIFGIDVDNCEVYDMYLHDNTYDLMHFSGCTDVSVHDNVGREQGHEFVWFSKSDGVEVYNNDISVQVNSGIRSELTTNLKIHDNRIYAEKSSGYVGIYVQSYNRNYPVNSIEIYNNLIHDTMSAGIYVLAYDYGDEEGTSGDLDLDDPSQASDVYIHHNTVYNTGLKSSVSSPMGGIFVAGFDNTVIENNVIDGVHGDGICIMYNKAPLSYSGIEVFVRNNIIVNCEEHPALSGSGYGINNWESSTHSLIVEYNDVYNNVGEYSGGGIEYSNNINIDPMFVDEKNHDYRLQSGTGRWSGNGWVIDEGLSSLIDAGSPLSDFSNEPEPNGKRVNIGVFGNTAQASKSVIDRFASIVNSDLIVNLLGKEEVSDSVEVSGAALVSTAQCDGLDISYGTVSIDGNLSDWQDTEGITIYGTFDRVSEENTSAVIKTKYDEKYLYVAYDVNDVDLQAERVLGQGGLHLDDSIELYVDTLNNKGSAMQPDDYHLIINLNDAIIDDVGTGSGKDYDYVINMTHKVSLHGSVNDASDVDKGFVIEVAVPWTDIGGKPANETVGMLLAVNDMDIEGGLYRFNYCNIPLESYAKPDDWFEATIVASIQNGN